MANLLEQYTNSTNSTFVNKVRMALLAAALSALQEETTTPNHANRVSLAKRILLKPEDYLERACQILAAEGLNASSDDTQILGALSALSNLFANTFTA